MANQFGKAFVLGALAAATVAAGAQAGGFCDKVRAMTVDPTVASAHWGVSVTALDGTVLCAVNEAQLFRPASNNKLLTAAAALALLGPEKRFTTTVVGEGQFADGVLNGNLKLVGGGDANFGSHEVPYVEPVKPAKPAPPEPATMADIEELADQIVAKGVKTITGDVIGDDSYFAWEPYPVGWGIDDLEPGYGAPVSALTIHDNELELDVAPGAAAGDAATVSALPGVPYYLVTDAATTTPAVKGDRARIRRDRAVGSRQITVAGEIPVDAATAKSDLAIHDPAEYAAMALKIALENRGVKIGGAAAAEHAAPNASTTIAWDDSEVQAKVRGLAAGRTNNAIPITCRFPSFVGSIAGGPCSV